ncbi:MAG: type II toxin-antitoxin system RelE/ParE family toxin [Paludibacter sp.]|nr:type II toxin-antitoxin system RelE/ParE family toxin [Paludibacter sp.]
MKDLKHRQVFLYRNYFTDFYNKQKPKVKQKILWTLKLIEILQYVPQDYFKHINEGIFEIRVQKGSDIFRIFCFFDDKKLIVLANGFQKKTHKTPVSEIIKAKKIKDEYESEKRNVAIS